MKKIAIVLIFFIGCLGFSQTESPKFNLDFEHKALGSILPNGWGKWGYYPLSIDSINTFSGNYSAKITSSNNSTNSFGSIVYKIPANYKGKKIRLEEYMKIRNVDGYAGLLLRLDGPGGTLQFDNMQKKGIKGSIDWTKYEITLPFPKQTKTIDVAGILGGNGEAWFDNFTVFIDGKNIQHLKEINKPIAKIDIDKEFDQGSGVIFPALNKGHISNLHVLGKIWGFLKYHHPEIAKGNYNWDYELFRILPKYLSINTNMERDQFLLSWIKKYGLVENCKKCKALHHDSKLKPDLGWITEGGLSKELSQQLIHIRNNRHQGAGYYIDVFPGVGNPNFLNERPYNNMPFPDAGFRLLCLYRYWNMINYFFPNKHLMDDNWDDVLFKYTPLFLNAKNELEYEMAALELIGKIQDTHANLWNGNDKLEKHRGKFYAPVHLRFIEDKLIVADYYNPELKIETKLEVGDIITHVNGKDVNSIIKEKLPYYPASNYPSQLRDMASDMLRSYNDSLRITYTNNDISTERVLKLYPRKDLNIYRWYPRSNDIKSYRFLKEHIGYVTLQNITYDDVDELRNQFINTKGIIVDIRNYPSEFVPFALGSYFTNSFAPFVKFTNVNLDQPGEFIYGKDLSIPPKGKHYKGKVVVLINEYTQSQAEYTAMAFRAGTNTTILGSTTAGADGNVSRIVLPGGLQTMISGIGVYYPDGKETQRVGILPDIEVTPTIEEIKSGRDELLERAINLIDKQY